jgi:bifunctional DNase/RNase
MKDPTDGTKMVDLSLGRIVIREGSDQQYIFLRERAGKRGFPIVIGTAEACEIRRVVTGIQPERPLTHQLAYESIRALGADLKRVDIVDLRNNTFFAQLVLHDKQGELTAVVDARPSDAVALALRAKCQLRIAESVLELVRTDTTGPDPLPGSPGEPEEKGEE